VAAPGTRGGADPSRNEAHVKIEPDAAGMNVARLERITEHFEGKYVKPGLLAGCQITVVRGGHLAYQRSLGLMDRERGRPTEDDAIFRIYSMTKPIASVALMQLYERGMFQLADPVHRYIPEWRNLQVGEVQPDGSLATVRPPRPMNVKDVLMHMTGLPGGLFPGNPIDDAFEAARRSRSQGLTLEGVTSLLAEHPLKFNPGTRWNYGLSTDIVGRLVEILTGERFDEYLGHAVFEPLGMEDTGFFVPEDKADRLAALYQFQPGNTPSLLEAPEQSRWLRPPTYLSGAGGLVSTTNDYVAFCQMLANRGQLAGRRILGRKTLELMTANFLPGGATLTDVAVGGFGEAGFDGHVSQGRSSSRPARRLPRGTWGGAASTAFWIDPVEDLFAVFMTQLIPSVAYPIRAELRALVYQAIDD
jgi:CubicO group peptidase (beta-lactamase class C family)